MTKYKLVFADAALKQLRKLDKSVAIMITSWLIKNIDGCENPRAHGKALVANRAGEWRYRIGDYRALAYISDGTVTVQVFKVGHRKQIYEK